MYVAIKLFNIINKQTRNAQKNKGVFTIINPTIVFEEKNKVVLVDTAMPEFGTDQMLIKTEGTQISIGTELSILMRDNVESGSRWDIYGKFPFKAGYTNIGTVEAVGEGVDKSWLGKRVASYGLHSKYNVFRPEKVYSVPEHAPTNKALFFGISEIAMNGVHRSGFKWGDSAVVYGAGVIGQLTAQYLSLAGAYPVFVADISDNRLSKLPKRANIIPVNTAKEDIEEVITAKNHGRKADMVFELTGEAALIPGQVKLIRRMGKLIILSSPRGSTVFDFHDLCNLPNLKIIGIHNASHPAHPEEENQWTNARDAEMFFSLLENGSIEVEQLITHEVPYTEALDTYRMLMENKTQALAIHLLW